MTRTNNSKKNVKQGKPTCKRDLKSAEKTPTTISKIREESKQATLIKLLKRSSGASISEMAEATGWQRHSVRGIMSGVLKKHLGLSIASEKEEHGRIYRIVD